MIFLKKPFTNFMFFSLFYGIRAFVSSHKCKPMAKPVIQNTNQPHLNFHKNANPNSYRVNANFVDNKVTPISNAYILDTCQETTSSNINFVNN